MKTAKEFRAEAWSALTGRYWWTVLAGLIAAVLGGAGGTPSFSFHFDENSVEKLRAVLSGESGQFSAYFSGSDELSRIILAVLFGAVSFLLAYGLALYIIGGAVELGYDSFNVKLFTTREKPVIGDVFSRFSIFGRALWLRVLMGLKTFAWSLLFIVPGIIAAYRYALAPYLMAENPALSASEAIERSKALMRGHKWRLFCLGLSFIGWYLLAWLTAGVGMVFLIPYVHAATAAFYLERTGRPTAQGQVVVPAADAASEPVAVPVADGPVLL